MQTMITARHGEVSEALRARALAIVERVAGHASRPIEAAVVFDADGVQRVVELRLHLARGDVLVAKGEAPDHRSALDRAEAKLRRQLEKADGRPRRSRSSPSTPTIP